MSSKVPSDTPVTLCPSCGASFADVDSCPNCPSNTPNTSEHPETQPSVVSELETQSPLTPRLIEFPGVARNTMPEWRRELSERVREVQERRAREALQEAAEAERRRLANESVPQLELLTRTADPPLNPLVAAALRRIERANHQPASAPNQHAPASLLPKVTDTTPPEASRVGDKSHSVHPVQPQANSPTETERNDRTRNLVVVPAAPPEKRRKAEPVTAKGLLREDDGVLDYLVAVPQPIRLEEIRVRQAGMPRRMVAAVLDLLVCALIFSPFLAVMELTNSEWLDLRNFGLAVAFATFVIFLYSTFSTALAGRTLGMRILSLRTVDRKTGLIPTGTQSVARALIFLASIFALGIPIFYTLIQGERFTAHDRFTGTAVVH